MVTRSCVSLIDHFAAQDDPRQSDKVLYPLAEILLVVRDVGGIGGFR